MARPVSDADIGYCTAGELGRLYRDRELSPPEAMSAIFRHIHTVNPRLNAFSSLMEAEATAQARASQERIARGEARPLEGIPVTIKDFYEVAGQESETGSFALRRGVAAQDNPVVKRLRDAGAVILGKTTMSEFAWSGLSRNPVNGITHNPWGRGLNAGASSAGAGAAAAAGFGPLHVGSDGAGSIRMPAHFCGIFGLKPTYGRIPHIPVSNNDYGTYLGPMSRSVADSALMLRVMAGPHPLDHTCCEAPPPDYAALLPASLKGRKIAYSRDLGHARVDPEVAALVDKAVAVFGGELGAEVHEVTPAWGAEGKDLGRFFWAAYQSRNVELVGRFGDRMDPGLVACMTEGARYSALDYLKARERKYAYIAAINAMLDEWDYLLTPAASVAAFPAERLLPADWPDHPWDWLSWAEFSYPFNMAQCPAASVPCGFTAQGLPVGLQIVSRRFGDLAVLQAAHAFEQAAGLLSRRPPAIAA